MPREYLLYGIHMFQGILKSFLTYEMFEPECAYCVKQFSILGSEVDLGSESSTVLPKGPLWRKAASNHRLATSWGVNID